MITKEQRQAIRNVIFASLSGKINFVDEEIKLSIVDSSLDDIISEVGRVCAPEDVFAERDLCEWMKRGLKMEGIDVS